MAIRTITIQQQSLNEALEARSDAAEQASEAIQKDTQSLEQNAGAARGATNSNRRLQTGIRGLMRPMLGATLLGGFLGFSLAGLALSGAKASNAMFNLQATINDLFDSLAHSSLGDVIFEILEWYSGLHLVWQIILALIAVAFAPWLKAIAKGLFEIGRNMTSVIVGFRNLWQFAASIGIAIKDFVLELMRIARLMTGWNIGPFLLKFRELIAFFRELYRDTSSIWAAIKITLQVLWLQILSIWDSFYFCSENCLEYFIQDIYEPAILSN